MIIPKYIVDQNTVNKEIRELNNVLNQQRQLKKNLLLYLEKISEGIYNSSYPQDTNKIHSFLDNVQKGFDRIKENMSRLIEQKNYLENIVKTNGFEDLNFEIYNTRSTELMEKINNDNNFYYEFMESLFDYINVTFPEISMENTIDQKSISDIYTSQINALETVKEESKEKFVNDGVIIDDAVEETKNAETENVETESTTPPEESLDSELIHEEILEEALMDELETSSEEVKPEIDEEKIYTESTIEEPLIEIADRTLFISYKDEYAILPHTTEDLEQAFSNNPEKYSSLEDLIKKEYTISLKDYKINSTATVYDECFNLAKNKSEYSSLKAMKFANTIKKVAGVNPLVIRSCNNVEEVEYYINCLENNKLDNFSLFKIIEEK